MEKIQRFFFLSCCEIAIFAFGYWVNTIFPDAPHWIWPIVGVFALVCAYLTWPKPAENNNHSPSFLIFPFGRRKGKLKSTLPFIKEGIGVLEECGIDPYRLDVDAEGNPIDPGERYVVPQKFWRMVADLASRLNALQISCPESKITTYTHRMVLARSWHRFLIDLAPLAEAGNLKKARECYCSSKNEQTGENNE